MKSHSSENDLASLQTKLAQQLTGAQHPSPGDTIEGISANALEQGRETLVRKRISQTRYWLPRTASSLGDRFAILFRSFASEHHFNGQNAIACDAIRFANWLRTQDLERDWIAELAQWESLDCIWQIGRCWVRFYRFHYDFSEQSRASVPPIRTNYWICVRCNGWSRRFSIYRSWLWLSAAAPPSQTNHAHEEQPSGKTTGPTSEGNKKS